MSSRNIRKNWTASGSVDLWRFIALFMAVYLGLQLLWIGTDHTLLVEYTSVWPAAALIELLSGTAITVADTNIMAPDVAINVRPGCEGTEILFPLWAALVAHRFSRTVRWVGLIAGTLLALALNQARLLVLFFSLRHSAAVFGALHGVVAPLLLIVAMLIFFLGLLRWERSRRV